MGNYAGITINSSQRFSGLGRQVSDIGDFNGDGVDDFLVSAPDGRVDGIDANGDGVTFVVFGSDDQQAVLDLLAGDDLPGEVDGTNGFALVAGDATSVDSVEEARFRNVGRFAAGLGDINGDGFADIAIGGYGSYYSEYYDGYSTTQNFLYVVFGSGVERNAVEEVSDQPATLAIGGMSGRLNGLSSAGDVNGDGFNDLIITQAPQGNYSGYYGSGDDREIGYVLFGDEALDDAPDGEIRMFELDGSNGFEVLGLRSDAGGFYGDGYSSGGQISVYGHDIVQLGDVNGDGFDDLLLRSTSVISSYDYGYSYYRSSETRAFIWFGRDSVDQPASVDLDDPLGFGDFTEVSWEDIVGDGGGGGFYGEYGGYSYTGAVAGIGDFNGDGYDDVAVSFPSLVAVGAEGDPDRFELVNGGVYVLFGSEDGPPTFYDLRPGDAFNADLTLINTSEGVDRFGAVLAGAGDVNGDGFDDFLIGQRDEDYFGDASLFLVLGGDDFDPSVAIDLSTEGLAGLGDTAYRIDGTSFPSAPFRPGGFIDTGFLSTAGDVNGDGFDDIVVGAPYDSANPEVRDREGRAFVIYGGVALEAADAADGFDDNVIDAASLTVDVETGALPINVGLQGPGSIAEGDSGATLFIFTVGRTGDVAAEVSVDWAVSAAGFNTASANDFVGGAFPSGTATFAAGEATVEIPVEVQGDLTIEGNEVFALTISNLSIPADERGEIVGSPTSVATILNDDQRVEITIEGAASGFEDDGPITVDIIRSGNTAVEVTANYEFTSFDVEADDLEQVLPLAGSVTFAPGVTRIPIEIRPSADLDIEPDEFVQGLITSAALSGADAGGDTPVDFQSDFPSYVRIRNDDQPIVIRPGSASVEEGGDLVFSIFRSGDTDGEVEVFWEVAPSSFRTADAADLDGALPRTGSVVFADGETSNTVSVGTVDDLLVEGTEQVDFRLTGSSASGAVQLSTFTTRGTIRDNDFDINVRVSNAYATEDGGQLRFVFTRSGELGADATVDYAITPGTAGAAASSNDLVGGLNQTGQVSFMAGETTQEIFVPISTDSEVEPTESVDLILTGGSTTPGFNVVLQNGPSRGFIYNDDFFIDLGVSGRSATEGDDLVYTITRSGDTGAEVTVDYSFDRSGGGDAAEAEDIVGGLPQDGSVTFLANETRKTIRLGTVEDALVENDELVEITLDSATSNGSNQITGLGSRATAAIRNDDFPVLFSASGGSVAEDDGPLTFTVVRSGNTSVAASVDFSFTQYPFFPAATSDDIVGGLPQSGVIDFAAGETRKFLQITPVVDFEEEPTETVQLNLTAASAADGSDAVIQTSEVFGRIVNDDLPPSIRITGGGNYFEGTGGLTPVVFTFTRTGDLDDQVTVQFDLPRGTADQSDVDTFLPAFGRTVVFEPGQAVVTDVVNIIADGIIELNENFGFQVTSVVSTDPAKAYDLFGSRQNITIINDDGRPPVVPPGIEADVFGDPHIVTLDGLTYSFMAVGEFILAESAPGARDPFQVQVRFEPAPGSGLVSVTTRMAVQVGDHVVEIDALGASPLLIDGVATSIDVGLGSVDIDGDGTPDVYLEQDGGMTAYTVVLNETGEQLKVGMFEGYINVCVFLGADRPGSVRGLMGDADGETDNDISLRDGSIIAQPVPFEQLYGDYAASWRLDASGTGTDKASLFTYEAGEETSDFTDLAFPAGVVDLDDVPQSLIDEAEAAATEAGITDPILREAAILDFIFTGDPSFLVGPTGLAAEPETGLDVEDAPEIPLTLNVSGDPNSIVEGDDGAQTATFTFYRTGPSVSAVTIAYVLEGVDAADLAPGTALGGTVLIDASETETTLEIDILGDLANEADETLTVRIASVSDGVIGGATGRTLILNDDLDPIAVDDAFTVGEDETLENSLFGADLDGELDEDPDGDPLTVASVQGEDLGEDGEAAITLEFGTLTVRADGSFEYDPSDATAADLDDDDVSTERFTYVVADGNGGFDEAEVEIAIVGDDDVIPNTPPTAANDDYATGFGETLDVAAIAGLLANDGDLDGDDISVVSFDPATNGNLAVFSDGSFSYTPNAGFSGMETVDYTITDGFETATASLTIEVGPNAAPTAADDDYATGFGEALSVAAIAGLLANDGDPDGDDVTVLSFDPATNGNLAVFSDGSFSYTPNAGFSGMETVDYTITDGFETATASLTIEVGPNAAPTAADDDYATGFGEALSVAAIAGLLANDGDPDGDDVTVLSFDPATNGNLAVFSDGSFSYTPNAGFSGTETVDYTITDGFETATASLTIEVGPNAAPTAADDDYATGFGEALSVAAIAGLLANDGDPDGDDISVVSFDPAMNGNLLVSPDGAFSYTPNAGFSGTETVEYTITDGFDNATASLTIEVGEPRINLVEGTDGRDNLIGTAEADRLVAKAGSGDRLTGGDEADEFVFSLDHASNGQRDVKTILDFEVGVDTLVLEGGLEITDFRNLSAGAFITLSGGDRDQVSVRGEGIGTLDDLFRMEDAGLFT